MLESEVQGYLKDLGKLGLRVTELASDQCNYAQKLSGVLQKELNESEQVLSALSERDWHGKRILINLANIELDFQALKARGVILSLSSNIELIKMQIETILEQIARTRELAKEPGEQNLGLILSGMGVTLSIASGFATANPLVTSLGILISGMGLVDNLKNRQTEYDKALERQKRQADDENARLLFKIAKDVLICLDQVLSEVNSKLTSPSDFQVTKDLQKWRDTWVEKAGITEQKI